ncbi:nitrilase-related carbon-nitrogen hydrolase [Porphyromonas macacae]|uniref:nitrilase-related carbon-nitrogen hydrolase n=1 Tax=Porphyromonas macacae TaxID=28115 RepID=UPI0035A0C193
MKKELKVALMQMDICWGEERANLQRIQDVAKSVSGKADILAMPEMATTGFMMDERVFSMMGDNDVFDRLQEIAEKNRIALTGSVGVKDGKHNYNRAFLIAPHTAPQFQDKRHLFSPAQEDMLMTAAKERNIWQFEGWKILTVICYDLRFPVWCRNHGEEFDLLLAVANWPVPRRKVWKTLLLARALENQCYVIGVNRVGADPNKLLYPGDSMAIDARGEYIIRCEPDKDTVEIATLDYDKLAEFKRKFPVLLDGDDFSINL